MISVITVNYKTVSYVERMLESLFSFHGKDGFEVFVVENASGDSIEHLKERFSSVIFIESKKNLGFAGGCNLGIKQSTGDFVCLVNPDIQFMDDALYQIEKAMNEHPAVGIGGISLKFAEGSQQSCVWAFPEPLDQLLLLLKIPHLFPNLSSIARWKMHGFDYTKSSEVDQVMGAFFCIRRSVLDDIGLLDGGFFLWYEEVDFCKRAKNAGWNIFYFSDIQARHRGGSSFDQVFTFRKQRYMRQSLRRYMKKHFGLRGWFIFIVLEPIFLVMGWLASVRKIK